MEAVAAVAAVEAVAEVKAVAAVAAVKAVAAVQAIAAVKAVKAVKAAPAVDSIELKIASTNSGASTSNTYNVLCSGCIDTTKSLEQLDIPISLKVLSDILGKCANDFVGIDIDIDDTGSKCIRISDINLEERANADNEVKRKLELDTDDDTPDEERLKYRESTLVSKHYTISSK